MTKLIFALHGSDLSPAPHAGPLHEPGLRDRLRDLGVRRLQVNLDDADVAAAPLRFGPGTPITGVVSLWGDDLDTDAVVDAIRAVDPTADGWEVEERLPIAPPSRNTPEAACSAM